MNYINTFENFNQDKPERRPRPNRESGKRCLGQCDRKVVLKDGKPAIYCQGCDRYLKSL